MDDLLTVSRIRTAVPHPVLAAHVRAYVSTDNPAPGPGDVSLTAHPSPVLFVTWGGSVTIVTAGTRSMPTVALFGPSTRQHRARVGVGACGFHVRFSPTGARALLGERATPDMWDDGLPTCVQRWAEAVAEAASFEARCALTDSFFQSLSARRVRSATAACLVVRSGGAAPVAAVAEALGVSERTLRRHFADDVGIGVKTFAQVVRYRQAHGFLLRTPSASWRDVCEAFGYADQPHFVRAFHRFSGESPTRWNADAHEFDIGFGLRDEGVQPV